MAELADVTHESAPAAAPAPAAPNAVIFRGMPRNMVVGTTLLLAGALAFLMGMTDVFFARAMAWVFVIWGALFLLNDLRDWARSWAVSDEGLRIGLHTPFWQPRRVWNWDNINRMDLIVKRNDPKPQDMVMQVYCTPPGDSVLLREDKIYVPMLAELIAQRAKLKPTHANNPPFDTLPTAKGTYVWNKSGKFVAAM